MGTDVESLIQAERGKFTFLCYCHRMAYIICATEYLGHLDFKALILLNHETLNVRFKFSRKFQQAPQSNIKYMLTK